MFITEGWRTGLIWLGGILAWAIRFIPTGYGAPYWAKINGIEGFYQDSLPTPGYVWLLYILAFAVTLTGCYIWIRLKERHWVFLLWGILTPIGLLGISLLKDRNVVSEAKRGGLAGSRGVLKEEQNGRNRN